MIVLCAFCTLSMFTLYMYLGASTLSTQVADHNDKILCLLF